MNHKYKSYDPETLAMDPDFIAWVRGQDDQLDAAWHHWMKSDPKQKEKVQLAKTLVEAMQFEKLPMQDHTDALWQRIETTISKDTPTKQKSESKSIYWRMGALAIAASLAFLLYFQFVSTLTIVETAAGQDLVYSLPDKSEIHLNDGSRLSFDPQRYDSNRSVTLVGEAFFQIEEGSNFKISTPEGEIEVLGTSFNVYSRSDGFEVHCFTGSVRVSTSSQSQVLKPGEMISVQADKKSLDVTLFDLPVYKDWRQGVFNFESQPLKNVLGELARQYDLVIELDSDLDHLPYTGFFEISDLEKAIYNITWPLKLEAEVNGKEITINRQDQQ